MRHRWLVLFTIFVALGAPTREVLAQAQPQPNDKELARKASKVLMTWSATERKAFTRLLAVLEKDERRKVLRKLIESNGEASPKMEDQLKALWDATPADRKQQLIAEAMKVMQTLEPDERAKLMQKFFELQQGLNKPKPEPKQEPKKGPMPDQPRMAKPQPKAAPKAAPNPGPRRSLIGRVLKSIDDFLVENGEELEETARMLEGVLTQGREYLELYRSMPEEQREEVRKEVEEGLKVLLQENVLPELDARIEGFEEARKALVEITNLIKEYREAFSALPEDEREQVIRDLIEAGKLLYEETLKPELERMRKLPPKERRKAMGDLYERMRGMFR